MANLLPITNYIPLKQTGLLMHLNFLHFPSGKKTKIQFNRAAKLMKVIFYNTSHQKYVWCKVSPRNH